jgi:hypothetical protein
MPRRAHANAATDKQLMLPGLSDAIERAERQYARLLRAQAKQAKVVRALFAMNGFDADAGDLMFHAHGEQLDIPPQYAQQVRAHALVRAGRFLFMKNPETSLF